MMPRFHSALVALLLCLPILCWAQATSNTTQRDSRRARQDARELRLTNKQLPQQPQDEIAEPPSSFTLGVAYDRGEGGGRSTTTPFALTHAFGTKDDGWKLQFKGDGYTQQRESGTTVDGLADLQLQLDRPLGGGFTASISLALPTKGDVGSQAASQGIELAYDHKLGDLWSLSTSAGLFHENGSPADTSAYTKQLYVELSRELANGQTVLANMTRTWRGGAPSTTDLGVEYGFPLPLIGRKLEGALSLVRGITSGSRHTTIEFDVSRRF